MRNDLKFFCRLIAASFALFITLVLLDSCGNKKQDRPFYTFTIDGSDSTLRYKIMDGNRYVGTVPSLQLDSLMNVDNQ